MVSVKLSKRDDLLSDNPAKSDSGREHGGAPSLLYRSRDSRQPGVGKGTVTLESDAVFFEETHRYVASTAEVKFPAPRRRRSEVKTTL
jgi:hypothetical protein